MIPRRPPPPCPPRPQHATLPAPTLAWDLLPQAGAFCYEELVLISPSDHVVHCRLGEVYYTMGGKSTACCVVYTHGSMLAIVSKRIACYFQPQNAGATPQQYVIQECAILVPCAGTCKVGNPHRPPFFSFSEDCECKPLSATGLSASGLARSQGMKDCGAVDAHHQTAPTIFLLFRTRREKKVSAILAAVLHMVKVNGRCLRL